MKEVHGIICECVGVVYADNEISVRVYDGNDFIGLVLSHKERTPKMTAQEAMQLARELRLAAVRLQRKSLPKLDHGK